MGFKKVYFLMDLIEYLDELIFLTYEWQPGKSRIPIILFEERFKKFLSSYNSITKEYQFLIFKVEEMLEKLKKRKFGDNADFEIREEIRKLKSECYKLQSLQLTNTE